MSRQSGLSVSGMTLANEAAWRPEAETRASLLKVWHAMKACVDRGCRTGGTLPGGFKVRRRAKALREDLTSQPEAALRDPLQVLDWVNLYALAVNEENAAGGRVVTARTPKSVRSLRTACTIARRRLSVPTKGPTSLGPRSGRVNMVPE